jgi:peptidoglycan/xylan/chitin deacetylase (PgdA/CDA1 family)
MRKFVSDLVRRVSPSRSAGHAVVLMYHRIEAEGSAGGGVTVSPARFAEQLQALQEHFLAVQLSDLTGSLARGTPVRRSVAITFDDGYIDNLTTAKPLLERNDVPATVFVVSGYVGSGKRFWWDELEQVCTNPRTLPDRLELTLQGATRTWAVDADADRRPLFRDLRGALGTLEESERDEALAQLRSWANVAPDGSEVASMTADQLQELARGGLVDIGAHTVTHPILAGLPKQRQMEEIGGSVRQLEAFVGRDLTLFSYPFGAHDRTTVACAREARLACACTTIAGGVGTLTDPYRLPRLYVGDWPADELVARISERLL